MITLTGTSEESNAFTVRSSGGTGSDILTYTLTKGETAVSVNDRLLTVAGGGVYS
ncbi:MAG: hypothetical protein LIO42_01640 [Oscillospiraceae bacterium]|nr:hypothetical protein [Oscillospiraceae bacterium]